MKPLCRACHVVGVIAAALLVGAMASGSLADTSGAKPPEELAASEKSLAERFDRLELLAGRLAELSQATQPRRAELLQRLVAQSRERNLPGRFEKIVAALEQDDLSNALEDQTSLHADLKAILELLLEEDRDRQLESERQRIAKYLADLNKLIRQQRGIRARTEGGDSEQQLGEDQHRTADNAGELSDQIEATEVSSKKSTAPSPAEPSDSPAPDADSPRSGADPSEPATPSGDGEQDPSSEGSRPKDSAEQGPPGGESADTPRGDSPQGDSQQGSQSDGSPPSDSPPSPSQPGGSPGDPGGEGQSSPSDPQTEQQQSPSERAVEKLRQAQQRMEQAEERLKEAQRKEAVEAQEQALRELEQAKAELEKILRQLREEEMERMLVLLEARLRKMLEMQNAVYDETIKLAESASRVPAHELEIACASQARQEDQIIGEADRALTLMREDGSSVAFPEALEQARDDMRSVARRLRDAKTDEVTQGLEQDIIATLEETLAALQKALKELREQKSSQQQQAGEPGEQPLVDQLAELRMIRALQTRVNNRTEFYDRLIQGDQAQEAELLEALRELANRQERIYSATRDLHQGTNR